MKKDSGIIISVRKCIPYKFNNEHASLGLNTIHILCGTYYHHITGIHTDNALTYLAISIDTDCN